MAQIGFIGLGSMGLPMAAALLKAGYKVSGYDVSPQALAALTQAGGEAVGSVAEAAATADVLLIMVVNAHQVEDVLFGSGQGAGALPRGAVVVVCSTVEPAFATRTAERLYAAGLEMIDAPVSGGVGGASAGALTIMAAGHTDAFQRVEPVLRALGSNIYFLGEQCGAGATMKMINQLLCGVQLVAAAEALALAAKAGLNQQTVYEIICNSAGMSWMLRDRGPRMIAADFATRSAVDIFLKDLGIVLDAGERLRFPLPLAAAAYQVVMMAAAAGHSAEDDSAIIRVYPQP
jgi:putative dehydrogenase